MVKMFSLKSILHLFFLFNFSVIDGRDQNALVCFLQPLLNALTKLNTHAYLPLLKADKSLQLLLKLLEMSVPKHNATTSEG